MPGRVNESWMEKKDSAHWAKAKAASAKQGHPVGASKEYAYAVAIFKKMARYQPKSGPDAKRHWKPGKDGAQQSKRGRPKDPREVGTTAKDRLRDELAKAIATYLKAVVSGQPTAAGGAFGGLHPLIGQSLDSKITCQCDDTPCSCRGNKKVVLTGKK